jgi:hypothetical protein
MKGETMGADRSSARFCNFPTLSARSIKDFAIPNEVINPDSELAKRAEDSAMELSRLSLLGIAGYGFLLKEMAMTNSSGLEACQKYAACILLGAVLLGIATSCALATRELSIRCSVIQIAILRTVVKLENGGWSTRETATLNDELRDYRSNQKDKLDKARHCLWIAHLALIGGTAFTVISFGLVLFALKPEPKKQSYNMLEQLRPSYARVAGKQRLERLPTSFRKRNSESARIA